MLAVNNFLTHSLLYAERGFISDLTLEIAEADLKDANYEEKEDTEANSDSHLSWNRKELSDSQDIGGRDNLG